ncbi:hypothetical protein J8L84_11950, partial [Alteromonas sp. MMG017]|uniref:hypothetical protein n=1 Tax=Alteromonas sp. MMG017 TaxID=2822692 RepID=UPI001B3A43DE
TPAPYLKVRCFVKHISIIAFLSPLISIPVAILYGAFLAGYYSYLVNGNVDISGFGIFVINALFLSLPIGYVFTFSYGLAIYKLFKWLKIDGLFYYAIAGLVPGFIYSFYARVWVETGLASILFGLSISLCFGYQVRKNKQIATLLQNNT